MTTVTRVADLPHPTDRSIGFVPTMGALHQGHLDLMRRAREENDLVVVSIFVNPTQFGKNEDFGRYPRDLERDSALAESVGVDVIFAPSVEEIYPRTPTIVHVPEVTELWEGAARPGHFDGVATVVAKLFNMVRPDRAYFGQKDLQQCQVVRRMVADLNFPLELKIISTTREPDGLAMSSRNIYLSEEERAVAPSLHAELTRCAGVFGTTSPSRTEVDGELHRSIDTLQSKGFVVDYFACVALPDLRPIEQIGEQNAMIVAARLGRTRLIDNVIF